MNLIFILHDFILILYAINLQNSMRYVIKLIYFLGRKKKLSSLKKFFLKNFTISIYEYLKTIHERQKKI